MCMNELMYERKIWNVYKDGDVINLTPIIDPNLKPIHLAQAQAEARKWIEAGWIGMDRNDMNHNIFKSASNESGAYMMIQYVPVKEPLDNQPNL